LDCAPSLLFAALASPHSRLLVGGAKARSAEANVRS
jgi:hypothetical protein